MRDRRKILIITGIILVIIICLGIGIWYILKDNVIQDVVKRAEYSKGEEQSQVNEYNDLEKWLSYEEYKNINSDVIGMIEFEDRRLPVAQADDNDEYLHTSIYGEEDIFGVPFLDVNIDLETTDNLIVHAHSTYSKDLLFTFFENYIDDPEWGKEHRNFIWADDTGSYEYSIISATQIDATKEGKDLYWYKWQWSDNMEKTAYVMDMINNANVYYSTTFNYKEKLITLVTCNMDNDDERYILTCTYVGEEENDKQ